MTETDIQALSILLKYVSAGVLFWTTAYFAWNDKLEKQFFALVIGACFGALGVNLAQ